jgi:hypothetical protein
MRRLSLTGAVIALSAITAQAQDAGMKGHHGGPSSHQKSGSQQPKADEKAYKSALDRIPDGGKYDPWGKVRDNPPAK